ncbi:tripartite tricarboxylate transporter substrate binding protein [Rubrivivax rivuli]|uniref:Tripartite tricarboxylate transporter substrate binding protein n=1 Tax=Rubrivivax rivuli TaxID=1862385 RepID=A0A437RR87_9BURK|nr:tripartite tricarboxylate transporter substrate binding protein [Rubrivivax rivuli]RVU49310.1 tripartite tricarboxylate transporter substrate binding protein [Rubrivivax rivuli]
MQRRLPLRTLLATALLAATALPTAALAQAWPGKQPVKLVAVFPPGGSVDQVSRILAPALQAQLGQTVIVENKGGASGSIGAGLVAAAPADGYTFAVVFDSHAVNPALQPNLPFDTRKDLATVAMLGTSPMVISTHVDTPYKTFADVVAAVKANKNVSYGTIGNGSLGHLAVTLLAKGNGFDLTHVPYRGGGPLMQDAIAGHVPLSIGSIFVAKPHIDSGRLRPLVVTTDKRSPQLPNVPTLAESGYAGFNAPAWWAVLAPAKTPPEIVARMNAEINKAMQQPDVAAKLAAQGITVNLGTPAAGQAFIERQIDTWAQVVKAHNIKAD